MTTQLCEVQKNVRKFSSHYWVVSLRRRPPRTWNALKGDDVSSCTRPPQIGGEWFPQVNVYFLGYTKTTGGLTRQDSTTFLRGLKI